MSNREITAARRRIVAAIKKVVTPMFRESGYRVREPAGSRPLKLWTPLDAKGAATLKEFPLRGFVLTSFLGFSEGGVITDCAGGGLVTESYGSFPLEDLELLHKWVLKNFATLAAPAPVATA